MPWGRQFRLKPSRGAKCFQFKKLNLTPLVTYHKAASWRILFHFRLDHFISCSVENCESPKMEGRKMLKRRKFIIFGIFLVISEGSAGFFFKCRDNDKEVNYETYVLGLIWCSRKSTLAIPDVECYFVMGSIRCVTFEYKCDSFFIFQILFKWIFLKALWFFYDI